MGDGYDVGVVMHAIDQTETCGCVHTHGYDESERVNPCST
jgi:hypothetical protein